MFSVFVCMYICGKNKIRRRLSKNYSFSWWPSLQECGRRGALLDVGELGRGGLELSGVKGLVVGEAGLQGHETNV